MLPRLGFPDSWVKKVMVCVKTVRYKVKINNALIDYFYPERGLLICSEGLPKRIVSLQENNNIKGN